MIRSAIFSIATTSALFVTSIAQAAPSSGLLLGIYAYSNSQGLKVTGTIPGYSAQGRLWKGDVLLRVTTDGFNMYPVRNHWQIEFAKDQIGPNQQAALEIYRPGFGYEYLWVEFIPVGGGPVAAYGVQPKTQMKARIFTEQEKPGAAAMFKKSGNQPGFGMPKPSGGFPLPGNQASNGAASLFGR